MATAKNQWRAIQQGDTWRTWDLSGSPAKASRKSESPCQSIFFGPSSAFPRRMGPSLACPDGWISSARAGDIGSISDSHWCQISQARLGTGNTRAEDQDDPSQSQPFKWRLYLLDCCWSVGKSGEGECLLNTFSNGLPVFAFLMRVKNAVNLYGNPNFLAHWPQNLMPIRYTVTDIIQASFCSIDY